jgi:tetratricopeptide (TPR) repeat protein
MMRHTRCAAMAVLWSAVAISAWGQTPCAAPVAVVESVRNSVQLVQASTETVQPAVRRATICPGQIVRVGENSRAVIVLLGTNTPLALDQNSELMIPLPAADNTLPWIELVRGALLFISRTRQLLEIRTRFVNAAIEGTEFVVRLEGDRAVVTVFEGAVRASNSLGVLVVAAGQQAVAVQGQPPVLEIPIRPRDAVQWALYYEPLLPSDSFEQLGKIPIDQRGADFYLREAALQLGIGQTDAARAGLVQARTFDPSNGDVDALLAIISVAQNDIAAALDSARSSVQRSPRSSSAHIALSYALQADFDLDGALAAVETAVALSPSNALGWARLSELRLTRAETGAAIEAAQRAVSLAPQSSRAQSVLGFAALADLDVSGAAAAFEQAITLEPDSPLPRLGLGLTKIRRGRLLDGRRDLEIASALNPQNAVIRSYLGKAYFDERRNALAGESFALAKTLDPLDPTPWLYDAVRKQTLHQPVDALADLRRSIQLNDNRAVYRSRFLLDGDQAIRGTRLARIYRDLGFEQLALLEGWRSLNTEPDNHSAHRLLADSYLNTPGHVVARDSELLQSQLLQPVNINPVQPRLADNGLSMLDDALVAAPGLNEHTNMFLSDRLRVVGDAIVGEHESRADNAVIAGVHKRLSFSVGQFHFGSTGFRQNHDIRQDIYNGFAQTDISANTSAQVEWRSAHVTRGDRRLLFDPQNFFPRLRTKTDTSSFRTGLRRRFTPASVVIASYVRRRLDTDTDVGVGVRTISREDAQFGEIRHIHKFRRLNATAGLGYYEGQRSDTRTTPAGQGAPTSSITRHLNAYAYATSHLTRYATVVTGFSADNFDSAAIGRSQVNPKLGLEFLLADRTMLRAATFRTLKRTVVSSQTIEPTQVAGFNQFFDEPNSSDSWTYAGGVNHWLGPRSAAGVDWLLRDTSVPIRSAVTGITSDNPRTERWTRAYVYVAVRSSLALNGEYRFEELNRDARGSNEGLLVESRAHKLAAEARLFHSSKVLARIRMTMVAQEGRFQNPVAVVVPGSDRFAVADASIGYRLPRQLGIALVDVRNIFNNSFRYQDRFPEDSRIQPQRLMTTRLTVTF